MQRTCTATALTCLLWWELCLSWPEQQSSWVGVDCTEENWLCDMFAVAGSKVARVGHTPVAFGHDRQEQSAT